MKRSAVALAFALAYCGLCGAFLPPLAVTTLNRRMPSPWSARGQSERIPRRSAATAVRMTQEPTDDELQLAVRQLAAQVEDLKAIVLQLAESGGVGAGSAAAGASSQAQNINGATVDSSAAVPAPPAKAAKGASAPLVGTSGAQERIAQWVQESGGAPAVVEASPPVVAAVPVAAVAPAAPAVVPPPVVPEVVEEVVVAPAAAAPADAAPAGSHKVKIEWEGAIHEVNCDGETTLLEAAMDAGLELPSSCMSGSCLTCPGKIVSGTVDQSEGVLEEEQTEAGFLLTCVSYPLSDVHFAVVDEEDLP